MEVKGELPYAVEMDVAGDQARSGRRHERKASRRGRLLLERKSELKNPPIRWGEEEEEEDEEDKIVDEDEVDKNSMRWFRRAWELAFGRSYGSFEDKTPLGPMRYTEGTIPKDACCETVVQIFSVQVTELKDGLKWPLHVYGRVATRDLMDHNRNLLFERERDNCQILSQQMGDKTDVIEQAVALFTPKIRGKSYGTCDLGYCKMEVIVAWSLFSTMEDLRLQNRI